MTTTCWFAVGAALAGGLTYGLLGVAGTALPGWLAPGLAIVFLAQAIAFHASGKRSFLGDRDGRQANRGWAYSRPTGVLYFGALLGVGLLTRMSSPLVHFGAALSLVSGPIGGLGYGIGFGVGRSIPAMAGALIGTRHPEASDIAVFFAAKLQPRLRPIALLACTLGAASLLWAL